MVDPHWVQVPPRSFNGPYMDPKMDFIIFEPFTEFVYHFYIVHSSRAPLTMWTTLLVIVELYQGSGDPPGPSWTLKWTPKWTLRC